MNIRKVMVQCLYYCLLFSTTAVIFMFVTTLNSVLDSSNTPHGAWYGGGNGEVTSFWGLLLIDQVLGLLAVITFRRGYIDYSNLRYVLLFVLQVIIFVGPIIVSFLRVAHFLNQTE